MGGRKNEGVIDNIDGDYYDDGNWWGIEITKVKGLKRGQAPWQGLGA